MSADPQFNPQSLLLGVRIEVLLGFLMTLQDFPHLSGTFYSVTLIHSAAPGPQGCLITYVSTHLITFRALLILTMPVPFSTSLLVRLCYFLDSLHPATFPLTDFFVLPGKMGHRHIGQSLFALGWVCSLSHAKQTPALGRSHARLAGHSCHLTDS